jgi:hypothetical protein
MRRANSCDEIFQPHGHAHFDVRLRLEVVDDLLIPGRQKVRRLRRTRDVGGRGYDSRYQDDEICPRPSRQRSGCRQRRPRPVERRRDDMNNRPHDLPLQRKGLFKSSDRRIRKSLTIDQDLSPSPRFVHLTTSGASCPTTKPATWVWSWIRDSSASLRNPVTNPNGRLMTS